MITEAEQAIEVALETGWTKTPIDWDNVQFIPQKGVPYIRMQIEWYDAVSAGPFRVRESGYVMFSVFVPVQKGTRYQADLIDNLKKLFLSLKISGFTFKPSRVQRVGENRGWYQRNLLVPFDYQYCKEVLP